PTVRGDPVFDRASADSLAQIPPGPRAIFVAPELDRDPSAMTTPGLTTWDGTIATNVPVTGSLPADPGELAPSDPSTIVRSTIRTFLLLIVIGAGWAWWAFGGSSRDAAAALAVSPALGAATLPPVAPRPPPGRSGRRPGRWSASGSGSYAPPPVEDGSPAWPAPSPAGPGIRSPA